MDNNNKNVEMAIGSVPVIFNVKPKHECIKIHNVPILFGLFNKTIVTEHHEPRDAWQYLGACTMPYFGIYRTYGNTCKHCNKIITQEIRVA